MYIILIFVDVFLTLYNLLTVVNIDLFRLIWQIIEIGLTAGISLEKHPNLACLLEEDEDISVLERMTPEEILLRWVNYQLRKDPSYQQGPIKNFKKDIRGK